MKKLIKIFLLSGIIIFTSFSCDENDDFIKGDGIIIDAGNPAVDGCGWLIEISNETYKPIELDEQFQENNLEVTLEYKVLDSERSCGWLLEKYKEINIKNIVKKSNN